MKVGWPRRKSGGPAAFGFRAIGSFVIRRGSARVIIGRYLDLEPRHVRFGYLANGKPAPAEEMGQKLKFKLVGSLAKDGWSLTEQQFRQAVREIQDESC
jgi:hypothetical protein